MIIHMQIDDIVRRDPNPEPWAEGEKIPWNDPDFSRRMLREHLDQRHDAASRRSEVIDRQVAWIHEQLLGGKPSRILDLGCGPGLYLQRLAKLGHACQGIDFAPAAVEYAREQAELAGLDCRYEQADLREAAFGEGFDLVMMLHGEINVFRPEEAMEILRKARAALVDGGQVLLEAHTLDAVREIGEQPRTWHAAQSGLFSDRPHLWVKESFWREAEKVSLERYFLLDAETAEVERVAATVQGYDEAGYRELLLMAGLVDERSLESLGERQPQYTIWIARRD